MHKTESGGGKVRFPSAGDGRTEETQGGRFTVKMMIDSNDFLQLQTYENFCIYLF